MAEVRKRVIEDKYNTSKIKKSQEKNTNSKNRSKKVTTSKRNKSSSADKKGLITKLRIFCNGVKSEFLKVHWPAKKDMIKYSVATIVFIVFCSLFFFGIDIIFAFIRSLFS